MDFETPSQWGSDFEATPQVSDHADLLGLQKPWGLNQAFGEVQTWVSWGKKPTKTTTFPSECKVETRAT